MTKRIGVRSKDTVDRSVLPQLNEGVLQAATLSECLSVDFAVLMVKVMEDAARYVQDISIIICNLTNLTKPDQTRLVLRGGNQPEDLNG